MEQVTISGGGLAGALLALMLRRRGIGVTVIESRPDMRRHDISAGRSINLALANRGIRALERAGVMDRVRPDLIPMRGRMLHDVDGGLTLQPYGARPEEVIYSVGRGALNTLLLEEAEAAGAEIRFEHATRAIDLSDGSLHVEHAGETFSVPGPTIACDGAGSPVRRSMQEAGITSVREDRLPHSYKELTIPAAEDGGFRMESEALHIWPRGGHMLIALPNPDRSFTVTLFLADEASSDGAGFDQLTDRAAVERLFQRDFPDAVAYMPDYLDDFEANPTGVLGTVRTERWNTDSVLLIGDAAHAIVPFHGQGMNCAFEDCVAVDDAVAEHGCDWPTVFRVVCEVRRRNADAIADMALENYVEMRDTVNDPRFHLMKSLAFELERRMPDRFVPRYSMVMFHHLPYADAYERGRIQQAILREATLGRSQLSEVDVDAAEAVARERLGPAALDGPESAAPTDP